MIGRLLCRLGLHRRFTHVSHHWCGFDGMGQVEARLLACRRRCGWSRRREVLRR